MTEKVFSKNFTLLILGHVATDRILANIVAEPIVSSTYIDNANFII